MKTVFDEWNMKCPSCGADDNLHVTAQVWARLTPDGTDADSSDQEWDSESACRCRNCGHFGTVQDFRIEGDGDED